MKSVAIHQLNFFPWLPFFHKLAAVDHFILLDDVQYERTGAGSWQNRVRLAHQGKQFWLTCPLDRSIPKTANIMQMRLHKDRTWQRKAIGTINNHYRKAAHFNEVLPLIKPLIEYESDNLADYNEHAIYSIAAYLGIKTTVTRSSSLNVTSNTTQRLIDLVKAVGGNTYYAGRNATQTYQDNNAFAEQGLNLTVENYHLTPYKQVNNPEFVPGLSILDTLLNVDPDSICKLLQQQTEIEPEPTLTE